MTNMEKYISLAKLCTHYKLEMPFFAQLNESGLIELKVQNEEYFLHEEQVLSLEKIIHLHVDLEINVEGIETILHLLEKIEVLQREAIVLKNRLRLYEEE